MARALQCVLVFGLSIGRASLAFAHETPEESFGGKHQLIFDASLGGRIDLETHQGAPLAPEDRTKVLSLAPSAMFFVLPNLAIGARVSVDSRSRDSGTGQTSVGLGPAVGYNVRLSRALTLMPQVGVAYTHVRLDGRNSHESWYTISWTANVPVLFHFAPHFFFGLGPRFTQTFEYTQSALGGGWPRVKKLGVLGVIGGWL